MAKWYSSFLALFRKDVLPIILLAVRVAVQSLIYANIPGTAKKAAAMSVVDFALTSTGITADPDLIDKLIESCVTELKQLKQG
ncbi:MAG: hypothetical protein WCS15_07570 [Prevotella sp.]